ncbi:hypothetical protein AAG570_007604 [Ranatra chinensis]|uniref:Glucose-methanol-choline oxidoreductase N-terminal domain-containing protein n=1 Tax=Ranatra chinensis TaxID=642074 RepID=A0ABD0XVZ8_9HEMI
MGRWSVLLLEAGGDEIPLTDVPLAVPYVIGTDYNWGYTTEPQDGSCLGFEGARCPWPKGKAVGGTSVINFMVYTRGFPRDYDLWEEAGHHGWGFESVLPYFKKYEDVRVPSLRESPFYSRGGYLRVERPKWRSPLAVAFLEAGRALGYPAGDGEGLTAPGFSYVLATTKRGARYSAAKAFLRPVTRRKNLSVAKRARVTKILIDPETLRAYGVEFVKHRRYRVVKALKEVILSAGAINSPQLLMLSGVGPRRHLEELGIPVLRDSPVGENLQDHLSMAGLVFFVNESVAVTGRTLLNPRYLVDYLVDGGGPLALPGGAEAVAFLESGTWDAGRHPDVELVFGPGGLTSGGGTTFRRAVSRLRPKSRGFIRLKSKNPFRWPLIYSNSFDHPDDLRIMVGAIRMAIRIASTDPYRRYNSSLLTTPFPMCRHHEFGTDEYWGCTCRVLTTNLNHQAGTCAMGSVLDSELRVQGVAGLRVVDASAIPVLPASHTNAVVYMMAEKAADMIKSYWLPYANSSFN